MPGLLMLDAGEFARAVRFGLVLQPLPFEFMNTKGFLHRITIQEPPVRNALPTCLLPALFLCQELRQPQHQQEQLPPAGVRAPARVGRR